MTDTILTDQIITKEALRVLHNNTVFLKRIDRQYDGRFAKSGAKIGDTLGIRRPVQFVVRDGNQVQIQDTTETKIPLTISNLKGIDWDFDDLDLSLKIDDFSDRYIAPAMSRLGAQLDLDALSMYRQIGNQVGTPGTTPNTARVYLDAGAMLDNFASPRDNSRFAVINPAAQAATVDALKGLFQSSTKISEQYDSGEIGTALGFRFGMDQNTRTHTVGALGGTPLVNAATSGIATGWTQTGTLITDGWTASALTRVKAGDVFTIANVYAVNPETKEPSASLMQFAAFTDGASDGSGNMTLTIEPAIITGGAYQNVDSVPADNAPLTFAGTASTRYPINMAFHKDAFTFATADLQVPKGMDMAARYQFEGISLRFIRGYDILSNRRVCRFDVAYGFVAQRPEWACRIIG